MSRRRHPGAHVLAWLHMQGVEHRTSIAEMAGWLGVRARTLVNWRRQLGFVNLEYARMRRDEVLIRHAVRIDPHLKDCDLGTRFGMGRERVGSIRHRLGIPEYRVRIRSEVREYLRIDPGLAGPVIRRGMEADGWVLYSDLSTCVTAVRREMAA